MMSNTDDSDIEHIMVKILELQREIEQLRHGRPSHQQREVYESAAAGRGMQSTSQADNTAATNQQQKHQEQGPRTSATSRDIISSFRAGVVDEILTDLSEHLGASNQRLRQQLHGEAK